MSACPKVSAAGLKVLQAFDQRQGDVFEIKHLGIDAIRSRSGIRQPIHKVLEVLICGHLLAPSITHGAELYKRTKAGAVAVLALEELPQGPSSGPGGI